MNIHSSNFRRTLALGIVLGTLPALGAPGTEAPAPRAKIDFVKSVLPVLQKSCFPCHAPSLCAQPAIPPDPVLIKRQEVEISHGKDALEMGEKFPFPDDRTPQKQMDKLEKVLRRDLMPPDNQKKLGLGSPLTETDRRILMDWISQLRKDYPG
jgi:hypothetical protein